MKLRNNVEFEYFGLKLQVSEGINFPFPFYFCTDEDGESFFCSKKPVGGNMNWIDGGNQKFAFDLDLEGKDWKETLVYVDEKGVTHYDV